MLAFENQNIEFKQEYVPDIRKEVMGFANAEGWYGLCWGQKRWSCFGY